MNTFGKRFLPIEESSVLPYSAFAEFMVQCMTISPLISKFQTLLCNQKQ